MKSLTTAILGGAACLASATARTVVVEHAFGPEAEFTVRGYMDLIVDPSREIPASAFLSSAKLETSDTAELKNLVDDDGLYLIRLATDDSSGNHVVAAVPACHLRLAGFREEITLHVETDGTITGVDYKAPVGPLASTRDCTRMPVPESTQISTSVKVVRAAYAQSVPLQVLTANPPPGLMHLKDNVGKQDPAAAGSQSILVKYWYIVLPLVVTWMFSTSGQPAQGTAGDGAGGAGAQVARGGPQGSGR